MSLTAPFRFWEPVRKSAMKQLFGYVPEVADSGRPVSPPGFLDEYDEFDADTVGDDDAGRSLPVVTYISRQDTGRRLLAPDHEGLVTALKGLEEDGVCIVRIPVMEDLSFKEQFAEIASSTVGTHLFKGCGPWLTRASPVLDHRWGARERPYTPDVHAAFSAVGHFRDTIPRR